MMEKRLIKSALIAASLLTASSAFSAATVEWSYEGNTGPEFWGYLSPDFATCKDGNSQSPIDIVNAVDGSLAKLKFDYEPTPLDILNNGHTLEVEYEAGSSIDIGGNNYRLLQFHFHTPSEHNKASNVYPMEAHFVHVSTSGELAVVGVFIKEGSYNKELASILDNAPASKGTVAVHGEEINALDLLPKDTSEYYHYTGSLTTPPCSEGVKWYVTDEKIEASSEQITQFQGFFEMNARPVQPLNGRVITERDD